jgi:hypothetical protein
MVSSHAVLVSPPTFKDQAVPVATLADACHFIYTGHGETGVEFAHVYFNYGRALLEMGWIEAGVLENALDGVSDEDENSSAFNIKPAD